MIGPDDNNERAGGRNTIDRCFDRAGLGARQILVGVVRIQSDQPWADGLMQRSLFG